MNGDDCRRQHAVIEAILANRWPEHAAAELRAHVAECETCTGVAELACALAVEREAACAEARVVPSGAVWWRAQMRARQQATRAATWPIAAVAGAMLACAAGFGVAVGPAVFTWLGARAPSAARFLTGFDFGLFAAADTPTASVGSLPLSVETVIWIGLIACLVLTTAAIYVVFADGEDRAHQS